MTKRERNKLAEFVHLGMQAGLVPEEDADDLRARLATAKTTAAARRRAAKWVREVAPKVARKVLNVAAYRLAEQAPSLN
jgi:hypothetical protein